MAAAQPESGFRLSPEQVRAFALAAGARGSVAPAAVGVATLRGEVPPEGLRRALETLAGRHEALRTTYRFAPGTRVPLQVIEHPSRAVALETCDLRTLSPAARREAVRAFVLARRPLEPDALPTLAAEVATLRPGKHLLKIQLPLLSADEASFAILFDEVRALLAGAGLPEPGVAPADYAEWRDEVLRRDDDEARRARAFWKAAERAPTTRHPLEREGAPSARASAGASLDGGETAALRESAARLGVSEEAFLLAAAAALLSRTSGDETVGLGLVRDARADFGLGGAVGLLSRVVPAALFVDPSGSFESLARRAARLLADHDRFAEQHPGAAFEGPLFSFRRGGTRPAACDARLSASAFELHAGGGASTTLRVVHDAARLPRRIASVMARGWAALLAAAAADPSTRCADLPILGDADRRALVAGWTRPVAPAPAGTVAGRFERQARETPDAEAFVCGGERRTYAELNARANQIAWLLRARGAAPDVPVGLCLPAGAELVAALLGIVKSGAAYLPLAPEHPPERLGRQLERAGARLVVASSHAPPFPASVRVLKLDDAEGLLARESENDPPPLAGPANLVYVMTTSGSTGVPRAVAVTHGNLLAYTDAILELVLGLAPGARSWATASSIAADLGNTAIFPALLGGGTLHLVTREVATDPALFSEAMQREPVDVLKIVPSLFEALLGDPPDARVLPRRVLVLGGEAFPNALARRIRSAAPDLAVVNHYGPTETTVGALSHVVRGADEPSGTSGTVPIGRPLRHARAYVLDARGEPAAPGTAGELVVAGEGVARGYFGLPEETASRFVPDPFVPGARAYRTGDLARVLEDGAVEFLGRTDDQLKVRGYRVEPGEIARALADHPAVARAFVARSSGRLAAWYVAREPVRRADLGGFLAERLPEYMIPQDLVEVGAFPLLPSGKVDRRALPEPGSAEEADEAFVAPRDEVEAKLAAIWSEVFGLPRLSVTANFFELGGHSLLATQILSRIARTLGRPLAPTVLFENPSIEAMARALSPTHGNVQGG